MVREAQERIPPDHVRRCPETLVHQDGEVGDLWPEKDDERKKRNAKQPEDLPAPEVRPHAPEVIRHALLVVRLRVAQRKEDEEPDGYGDERQGERIVPAQSRQKATDGGVSSRPDGEDAGVIAHRRRALAARVDVADDRHVQRAQSSRPHPLKQAEDEQQLEAAGEGTQAAGYPEEQQGGHEDFLAAVAVGEDAEDRGEEDAGEGEDGYEKPHLSGRDPQRIPDTRERRCDARHPEHRHQRHPEEDVEVVVLVDLPETALFLCRRSHEEGM